jgi:hypothetical protein
MDDAKWERWGALGGILFAVMVLVAGFLPGNPPKPGDPTGDMVKFVVDKSDEIRYAGYIGALATVPFFWFLGSLWRLLRRGEGGTPRLAVMAALGAGFSAVAGAIGGIILAVIPIIGVKALGGGGVRAFYLLSTSVAFLALLGIAITVLASSVVFLRSRIMPAALGWFGVLVTIVALVGAATSISTRDAIFAVGFAGFLGATLWLVILSVLMLRQAPTAAEPA